MRFGPHFWVAFPLVAMLPSDAAPSFGGEGDSSPVREMDVELRRNVANLVFGRRASAFVFYKEPTARECVYGDEERRANGTGRCVSGSPSAA